MHGKLERRIEQSKKDRASLASYYVVTNPEIYKMGGLKTLISRFAGKIVVGPRIRGSTAHKSSLSGCA